MRREHKEIGLLESLVTQVLLLMQRTPGWAKPPVLGAILLFGITLVRGVLLLAGLRDPRDILNFLVALIVAPAAGAVAGFAYVGIRLPARFLGFLGDLVTGLVVSWTYVLAILLPGKYLFGDDMLSTPQDWALAAVIAGAFGVGCTILYWYYRRHPL